MTVDENSIDLLVVNQRISESKQWKLERKLQRNTMKANDVKEDKVVKNKIVDAHWFMFIRRAYLTYNVILATLLVTLQGFAFGIQLFYMFRLVEVQESKKLQTSVLGNYSNARVVCYQLSVVGLLALVCFTFASLLSKAVQFVRLIWSYNQFTTISDRALTFFSSFRGDCMIPRIFDLSIQFILILLLELSPFVCAVAFTIRYNSVSVGFQAFLSIGSFTALVLIVVWWLGSIFENYKRLLMFILHRKGYFERLKSSQYVDHHFVSEKLDEPMRQNELTKSEVIKNQTTAEEDEGFEDLIVDLGNIEEEEVEESPVNQSQKIEATEILATSSGSTTTPTTRRRADSVISIFSHSHDDLSEYESIISSAEVKHSHNFVDVSKERNLWILFAWYCCLTPIGIPNLFKRLKDRTDRSKVYLLVRELWLVIGIFVVILCVTALGVIQQWKIYTLSAVSVACLLLNMLVSKFVYIPAHRPSKRRLKSAWHDSFIQRYIAVVEEVFYHSPQVVFNCCKLLSYIFIMVIAICGVFDFSDYHLSLSIYIGFLYVLRFNFNRYCTNLSNLFKCFRANRKSAAEADESERTALRTPSPNTESSALMRRISLTSKSRSFLAETQQVPAYLHSPQENVPFRVLSVVTFTSMLIAVMIILEVMTIVAINWAAGLALLAMLVSLCFILFKRFEQDAADALVGFFILYVVLLGFVFIVGGLNDTANEMRNYAMANTHVNYTNSEPYPICSKTWFNYNIIDYGFFANLAYSPDPYFTHDLKTWFPECTDCRLVKRANSTIYFYDLFSPSRNLSIVGVRGTTTPQDMIQDIDIWKEVGLLQLASIVGPFVNFWPESLTTSIIYWVYRIELFTMDPRVEQQRFYYQILDDYVESIKNKRQVVLVGHSLGGGLAKIIGARHGIPSIAFSGPGTVMSRKKLGLSLDSINRIDVNVKPGVDMVAKIDEVGGLVQNIDCNENFVKCHSLVRTVRNLITYCGPLDPNKGRWIG